MKLPNRIPAPIHGVDRLGLSAVLAWLLLAAPAAAEMAETFRFEGSSLLLGNLIGAIEVSGHDGSGFEVEVHVRGEDAARYAPEIVSREGQRARLLIEFPVEGRRRFVYPALGRGSTSIQVRDRNRSEGWLRSLIDAVSGPRIRVTGSGQGVEVWADVRVRVPRDGVLEVQHGVGSVSIHEVEAELAIEVLSGSVNGEGVRGDLFVSSGSGAVELARVEGELEVDTGSGSVSVADVGGPTVTIDTGSGTVSLADVQTRKLVIDTGSGGVRAEGISTGSALIDTGSGSVTLALVEMGDGDFEIDTGSGSITLLMPEYASADLEADTGSGGIQVDLARYETVHKERDEVRLRLGDGAARVRLDTGSGRIRVAPID